MQTSLLLIWAWKDSLGCQKSHCLNLRVTFVKELVLLSRFMLISANYIWIMKMNLFYELPSLDFLGQLCKNLREGVLFGRSLLRKESNRRAVMKVTDEEGSWQEMEREFANCSWADSYEWGCSCASQGKFLKCYIPFLGERKMHTNLCCAYVFCPTSENKQSTKRLPLVMDLFRNIIFKELSMWANVFFVLVNLGQLHMCPGKETKHGYDSFHFSADNADTKRIPHWLD